MDKNTSSGLFYITGIGGSGKSTVRTELQKRGYEAHDVDEGFAGFFHIDTGEESVPATMHDRTPEWRKVHKYRIKKEALYKLQKKARNKLIFLCGVTSDDTEYWDVFKKVFALTIDEKTLIHRLKTRTGNDWGKLPHELEESINWNKHAKSDYIKSGAEIINGTKPISEVVDRILANL